MQFMGNPADLFSMQLFHIIETKNLDEIKQAIQMGANPNFQTYEYPNITVLMVASFKGWFDVVKLLLELGADKEIKNADKKTALDYAKDFNHKKLVRLLKKT